MPLSCQLFCPVKAKHWYKPREVGCLAEHPKEAVKVATHKLCQVQQACRLEHKRNILIALKYSIL